MKKVSIYSTPNCKYCALAKEFFTENDIAYEEYNVASDLARRSEMIEKSDQMGVPVIIIGKNVVVGFNKSVLSKLLAI